MPDQVISRLTILVPPDNLDALKADLEGPANWACPQGALYLDWARSTLTQAQRHEIEAEAEALIAAFRALPSSADYPDWMPVSRKDIEAMLCHPGFLRKRTVPFSVARLRPWIDRSEFDRMFPGMMEGAYWARLNLDGGYTYGSSGLIALSMDRIDVRHAPIEIDLIEEPAQSRDDHWARLRIRFTTPRCPISRLDQLLRGVLERHGAKALLIWEGEGLNSGFDYINLAAGMVLSEDFGREFSREAPDPFWAATMSRQIDTQRFLREVAAQISDPDF